MVLNLATIGLCAVALPIFAYLQSQRRDHGLQGLTGFWAMLLARYALLALQPENGSWTSRYAGVCAVVAAAMLLYIARHLLAEARPGALDRRWRYGFWVLGLAALGLTLAPEPATAIAGGLLAVILACSIGLLLWAGPPSYRWLAGAVAAWGAGLLPRYPDQDVLAVLAPALFGWAWLWVADHRAALPRTHPGTPPEQLHLFRQSVRRSREFEILTHIGTALSSSLDAGALLQAIHTQLRKLMDVRNFYVAFQDLEQDTIRFAFEVEDGERVPPRSRPRTQALTEHVIATGQPLLISRDVDLYIRQHGLTASGRPAKNWLGVPVTLQGQPCGVIAVQSQEQEDAYDAEHLRVLEILASQAGVALENARLFAEVQRDAGQKSFLNHIARLSISTLSSAEMLRTVVAETAQAFHYDHITVALLRSGGERDGLQLEIAASAGGHNDPLASPLIPLGRGLAGRAAASGQIQQQCGWKPTLDTDWSRCAQARSGLALPIRYAGETLGVLHLESHAPAGFPPDQVQVLQTLTDQIAVALNHANLFQKLEHQAITDSLTGVKTRRFFMEALQGEWRRARAAAADGGPASFAIVLVDVDEFKPLNDRYGHLEGDRVLVRIARLLEQKSRASSVVARYGGDEFTILVPACPPEVARLLPDRLHAAMAEDPMLAQRRINASLGLALYPDSGASPEELLHRADEEMYRIKQQRQHRRAAVAVGER